MVIITAPIKGFLPKIKGGNCHIPISQNKFVCLIKGILLWSCKGRFNMIIYSMYLVQEKILILQRLFDNSSVTLL